MTECTTEVKYTALEEPLLQTQTDSWEDFFRELKSTVWINMFGRSKIESLVKKYPKTVISGTRVLSILQLFDDPLIKYSVFITLVTSLPSRREDGDHSIIFTRIATRYTSVAKVLVQLGWWADPAKIAKGYPTDGAMAVHILHTQQKKDSRAITHVASRDPPKAEDKHCRTCEHSPVGMMNVPCGHVYLCVECAEKLDRTAVKCKICGGVVDWIVRLA